MLPKNARTYKGNAAGGVQFQKNLPDKSHTNRPAALYKLSALSAGGRKQGARAPVGGMSQITVGLETTEVDSVAPGMAPGAPLSFDVVLKRYQDEIYRYTIQLTRNLTDADDLYQETLLKAYRAFGRLDGNANYRAWLYRIATNTFLSQQRKKGRERPLDSEMDQNVPAISVDPAAQMDAQDLLNEVETFIKALPPKQRIALVLRKYHELGYDQIAQTLNSSEDAARASVYEALRKLRACFGDRL